MERRNLVAGISAGIAGTSKLPNRVRALELLLDGLSWGVQCIARTDESGD